MKGLVDELDRLEEPTVVLFYGDHLSAVWPESVFEANPPIRQYETPYLVHANFPTEVVRRDTALGATYLFDELLRATDAPVTPLGALLEELSAEVPSYEPTGLTDRTGRVVEEESLSRRARDLLADYRLVQYDLAVGERHVAERVLEVPRTGCP